MDPSDWRGQRRAPIISRLTICIVLLTASSVFALWLTDTTSVQTVFPGISPVTALNFILLIAAVYLLPRPNVRRAGWIALAIVIVISVLLLIENVANVNLGVNHLFVVDALINAPKLFAPGTALTFIFISVGLIVANSRIENHVKWSQLLLIIAMCIAGIAFLGHLYGVPNLYSINDGPPMSLTTSVLFILVGSSILFSQRRDGLMSVTTTSAGGILIRRVLPFVIIVPHIFGLVFVRFTHTYYLDIEAATAMFIIVGEVILIATVWWNAQLLDRLERERHSYEQTLRESEARYRALFEHSSDTILIADDDAHYLDANPQAEQLTGYSREELLKLTVADISTSELAAQSSELYAQFRRQGQMSGEYIIRRKDGTEITVEYAAMRIASGVYQSVLHDITEYKRVEDNLRRALKKERELNELKSRFVSLVSHEFRAPLAIIRSSTDLLITYKSRLNEDQRQERLENVQTQVTHMVQLLEDVLTISRGDTVSADFNPKMTNVTVFCRQLVNDFSLATPTHTIVFTSNEDDMPATVDQKLLRQALTNLLSNAVKYSPANTQIAFELEGRDAEVIFRIQDFGVGIPLEDRDRMFNYFHRGRNAGSVSGMGLGLPIVKQAVETHGGIVSFQSASPETSGTTGTTFIIVLPRFQPAKPAPAPSSTPSLTPPKSSTRPEPPAQSDLQ